MSEVSQPCNLLVNMLLISICPPFFRVDPVMDAHYMLRIMLSFGTTLVHKHNMLTVCYQKVSTLSKVFTRHICLDFFMSFLDVMAKLKQEIENFSSSIAKLQGGPKLNHDTSGMKTRTHVDTSCLFHMVSGQLESCN